MPVSTLMCLELSPRFMVEDPCPALTTCSHFRQSASTLCHTHENQGRQLTTRKKTHARFQVLRRHQALSQASAWSKMALALLPQRLLLLTLSALCVDFFVFFVATLSATAIACTGSTGRIKRRPMRQGSAFVGHGGTPCALPILVTGPPTLSSLAASRRFCFLVLFPLYVAHIVADHGPSLRKTFLAILWTENLPLGLELH